MKRNSKYLVAIILFFIMPFAIVAQATADALPALVPLPVHLQQSADLFYINPSTKIVTDNSELNNITGLLNGYVIAGGGKHLTVTTAKPGNNFILLEIDTAAVTHKE